MKNQHLFVILLAAAMAFASGCGGEKAKTEGAATETPAAGDPAATKPAAINPGGTYTLTKDDGTSATLKVEMAASQVSYTLTASVGNAAEMERSATMKEVGENQYEDDDDACQIRFKFTANACELSYGGEFAGCGDVDAAGSYAKAQ